MDDNTRAVLVAVGPVLAGALVGALVAIAGFRVTNSIEERRAIRETAARKEAWDREDRRRWSSERRELYGRMLRGADDIHKAARDLLFRREHPNTALPDQEERSWG